MAKFCMLYRISPNSTTRLGSTACCRVSPFALHALHALLYTSSTSHFIYTFHSISRARTEHIKSTQLRYRTRYVFRPLLNAAIDLVIQHLSLIFYPISHTSLSIIIKSSVLRRTLNYYSFLDLCPEADTIRQVLLTGYSRVNFVDRIFGSLHIETYSKMQENNSSVLEITKELLKGNTVVDSVRDW